MGRGSVSDVGAVLRGSLAQNRVRVLIAVLAIALGVALGFAVQLVNQSAVDELTQGVRTIAGDADLSVRGPRSGFDEALFPPLARDPDVAVASPVVEVDALVVDRTETLRVLGLDLLRAATIQPALVPAAADGVDTLRSDTVFLSQAAARWVGRTTGETLAVQAGLADVPLRVAGTLAGAGQQRLAVMDIAGAQAAFGRVGRLSRIDLRLRPGVAVDGFRQRSPSRAVLPARFEPDGRSLVRFVDDQELAYVMQRHRELHDFWHTLFGLPPTVLGGIALKYVEMAQTRLPVAALSSLVGPLRLSSGACRRGAERADPTSAHAWFVFVCCCRGATLAHARVHPVGEPRGPGGRLPAQRHVRRGVRDAHHRASPLPEHPRGARAPGHVAPLLQGCRSRRRKRLERLSLCSLNQQRMTWRIFQYIDRTVAMNQLKKLDRVEHAGRHGTRHCYQVRRRSADAKDSAAVDDPSPA